MQVASSGDLVEHEGYGLQVEDGRSVWQVIRLLLQIYRTYNMDKC